MSKRKPNLKVVDGGKKDDGSSFAVSSLLVRFVVDRWKDGRKVQELVTTPIPVLAAEQGDSAFGFNIDKIASEVLARVKAGDLPQDQDASE